MSLPFKIKKMAIPDTDSSLLLDEVVDSIAKIKKQKQRPNIERIFSVMVKSYPELTLSCLNQTLERAIDEGLVVNYLHNGVHSYRVVPTGTIEVPNNKLVSSKSVKDAVKCLFYESKPKEYNLILLESLIRKKFPADSIFDSSLIDLIESACIELVQLGELTYAKGVYARNRAVQFDASKQFSTQSKINQKASLSVPSFPDHTTFSNIEPPDITNTDNGNSTCDHLMTKDLTTRSSNLMTDDTQLSKESSFNLQSPLSEASSDKPKRKKARSLQVSFLYDSLSNFFSISGEKRRTSKPLTVSNVEKSPSCTKPPKHSSVELKNRSQGKKKFASGKSKKLHAKTYASDVNCSNSHTWSVNVSDMKSRKENLTCPSKKVPEMKRASMKQSHKLTLKSSPLNSSWQFAKVIKSNLEEFDSNEINLAFITDDDQSFFAEMKSTTSSATPHNQSADIAFGRFLLSSPNASSLVKDDLKPKKLVMCEFCLGILETSRCLERHLLKCGLHCPPGDELYRHNDIKLFHVTNHERPRYCKQLGQLVQLLTFIDQSSSGLVGNSGDQQNYQDVFIKNLSTASQSFEEYNYFILTIQDRSGSHLAGILSYDNKSCGMWIVTCLFVLPQYRNQGHAKCLVNLVYHMASLQGGKVAVKLNIPLKNHVLNLFQSVWRNIIIDHIINIESHKLHFQLEEIAKSTSIELKDVSSSLATLKLESDFYLTEHAVDMTQSQKEDMKRGSESYLLFSGVKLQFNVKCCGNLEELDCLLKSELADRNNNSANDGVTQYERRHSTQLNANAGEKESFMDKLLSLLTSLDADVNLESLHKMEENDVNRKRKYEDENDDDDDDCNDRNYAKRLHGFEDQDQQALHRSDSESKNMEGEDFHTAGEAQTNNDCSQVAAGQEASVGGDDDDDSNCRDKLATIEQSLESPMRKSPDLVSPEGQLGNEAAEEQVETNSSNVSDADMPSLDDLAATPSTGASSVGPVISSPSPPELKKEGSNFITNKDEVTIVSSVRSDHSEVDVGGPTCSPMKYPSSLPSSVKNVSSYQCSTDEDQMINSVKNSQEDDDCTVVAVEAAGQSAIWSSEEKSPYMTCGDVESGYNQHGRNYQHTINGSEDMDKKMMMMMQSQHSRDYHLSATSYDDESKLLQHSSPMYASNKQQDTSYSRQCQSVAPVNTSSSSKAGRSKKSSKACNESGFCISSGERMNAKPMIGINSMQERCSSVFVDPGHYPPLPFNQGTNIGGNQLPHRQMDYSDGRGDRPATRCGFESSFPQTFNSEFSSRFMNPQLPSSLLDSNSNYQMQDCNSQISSMPPSQSKIGPQAGYNGSRSHQSSVNKSNKRTNKSQNSAPPVCYAGTKSSNVHPNSPTIAGPISMPSDPLFNALYGLPRTQSFENPGPSYGLSNRFSSDPAKSKFVSSNANRISYFNQQPSPPGACQLQGQLSSSQSHQQHINAGNERGNSSSESSNLHHHPDDVPRQQALILQQRQQQAAYLNPAAYLAKLTQFHSEFGHQFQYPAPFHPSTSPIDMSLHVPPRPSPVDRKTTASFLNMQQHRDSFSDVDFFSGSKFLNFGPYPGSVDPRNVQRNSQNQVGMFGHQQQQPSLDPGIQSPYSAYLNGGNRSGNDLFPNSNINDLMRK